MVSYTHAETHGGVDSGYLSKIWKINTKSDKQKLGVTTHQIQWTDNHKLSRKYGNKNRILWCKRIHEYLFMYTLFSKKKAGKLSQGHTCYQIFVTDKGFVYSTPIKYRSKVIQAMK